MFVWKKRLLQIRRSVDGLVAMGTDLWGVVFGAAGVTGNTVGVSKDSHLSYLSRILLPIGLRFFGVDGRSPLRSMRGWSSALSVSC